MIKLVFLAAAMAGGSLLAASPALPQAAPAAQPQASPYSAPKRRRIIIMRHGDVVYFTADGKPVPDADLVTLTAKGHTQADAAGKYFAAAGITKFDRVISSNLPRTVETADRVLAAGGFAGGVTQIPELREIKAGRDWRAAPVSDVPAIFLSVTKPFVKPETPFVSGETIGAMQSRVYGALDKLMEDQSWDTALLVLHAVVNQAIVSRALTGEANFLGRLESGAGCFHILDAGASPAEWILRAYNICPASTDYQASRILVMEGLLTQALRARQGQ